MHPAEIETLVQRLIADPHDTDALARAHEAGQHDPHAYASVLERVGQGATDAATAAHWLNEAATVWHSLGDPGQYQRLILSAADRDATNPGVIERAAQMYQEFQDAPGLVQLYERVLVDVDRALAEGLPPDEAPPLAGLRQQAHEQLAQLRTEGPAADPEAALRHWSALVDLDPTNVYAIYNARELFKSQSRWLEALPLFDKELAVVQDPERQLALLRDESEVRRQAGDLRGTSEALRRAHELQPDDPGLRYEFAYSIVERLEAGQPVSDQERSESATGLVALAELYDGEHAMMYAQAALRAEPGHDRAMQLADFHADQLGRGGELAPSFQAYLEANPSGYMAEVARAKVGGAPGPSAAGPSAAGPSAAGPSAAGPSEAGPSAAHASSSAPEPGTASAPAPSVPAAAPSVEPVAVAPEPSAGGYPSSSEAATGGYPSAPEPVTGGYPSAPEPVTGGYPSAPEAAAEGASAPPAAAPAPAQDPNSIEGLVAIAADAEQKGQKVQAFEAHKQILTMEPAHVEALAWVEDFLRQRRKFAELRDVLMAAAAVDSVDHLTRVEQLRDVAQMCEQKLRDNDGAVAAWQALLALEPADAQGTESLPRLLEKTQRWDDLAPFIERQAIQADDVEAKIVLEKKLADLHAKRRQDPASAAEAWLRIAELAPDDDDAVMRAIELYTEGGDAHQAASAAVGAIEMASDPEHKGRLLVKLGELRQNLGDATAGDAFAEASDLLEDGELRKRAIESHKGFERWDEAAALLEQDATTGEDPKAQAQALAGAADMLQRAGDAAGALAKLEAAVELTPDDDALAQRVEEQLQQGGRTDEQIRFLLRRAELVTDEEARVALRHRAAGIQRSLGDEAGMRRSLELVLDDGDDVPALQLLLDQAERGQVWQDAIGFLARLVPATSGQDKLAYAIREAQLLADGVGDVDAAIERYRTVLADIEPKNSYVLGAVADLELRRNEHAAAAADLEKLLPQLEGEPMVETARKLAQLYEGPLDDAAAAIRVLDQVHQADPDDLDAVTRLQRLAEKVGDWARVAKLLGEQIEVEGDEEEASEMTRRLAQIHAEHLEQPDQALTVLAKRADAGDLACQSSYAELGIELDRKAEVATKLVAWNESVAGTSRIDALRRAFGLFEDEGRDAEARDVAVQLALSKDCDVPMATSLEAIAVRLRDLDALAVAHDLLAQEQSGLARAEELIRQARQKLEAGADTLEAIQHAELGLNGLDPTEAGPLLEQIAGFTEAPGHVIDLYERQVGRCKRAHDRVAALAAAARVAAEHGALDRTKEFFDSALSGGVQDETLQALEDAARSADEVAGGEGKLLRAMAEALAAGGQGSRDGGRTRSALLRRAAVIAHRELGDVELAFQWFGDSLVAHVDDTALEALQGLGDEVGDSKRVEDAIGRALDEVYDGPLVRKLLRSRADLRRGRDDREGLAGDLKRLHELAPNDEDVTKELSKLLKKLGDHKGMIELYEDQILRGRQPHVRAELARKVARLWEEQIGDAREAADAWRRVLRMKKGDKEATGGLERAKSGKLKKPPPVRGKSMPPPGKSVKPAKPLTVPPPAISRPPGARSAPPRRPPSRGPSSRSSRAPTDGTSEAAVPGAPRAPRDLEGLGAAPPVAEPQAAPPQAAPPAAAPPPTTPDAAVQADALSPSAAPDGMTPPDVDAGASVPAARAPAATDVDPGPPALMHEGEDAPSTDATVEQRQPEEPVSAPPIEAEPVVAEAIDAEAAPPSLPGEAVPSDDAPPLPGREPDGLDPRVAQYAEYLVAQGYGAEEASQIAGEYYAGGGTGSVMPGASDAAVASGVPPASAVPASADEERYMQYLVEQGYGPEEAAQIAADYYRSQGDDPGEVAEMVGDDAVEMVDDDAVEMVDDDAVEMVDDDAVEMVDAADIEAVDED